MTRTRKKRRRERGRAGGKPAPRKEAYSSLRATLPFQRREWSAAAVLFAGALALRLTFFFINKASNPLLQFPVLDALFHDQWAREILGGDFWGDEVFFRAPLYPYFLAFLYKLGGSSIVFAVFVQHVIGALSVVLVYRLAREYFSPRVAMLSGILAALYWPFIYFEGDLLIVTLAVFLDVAALLLLSVAVRSDRRPLLVVSGFVLGLSAVARPSILILLPVLPLFFRAAWRPVRAEGRRPSAAWWGAMLLFTAGVMVAVSPVLVRNYVVGGDIVPIASQGGVNFYIGNNPQSNGSQAIVPGTRGDLEGTYRGAVELAERDTGHRMKPSEVSNYYFKKGLDFIVFSPGPATGLTLKKLYMFWAGVERSNSKYIQFFWKRFGLGRVPLPGFWFVGPLALMGGVLLWRRRRDLALLYLFTVSYMVGVVFFFVNARFRLPVAPVLIIFAAYALCHLFFVFRHDGVAVWKTLGILALCGTVVNYDFVRFRGIRSFDEAVSYYELGNGYMKMNNTDAALDAFEHARAIQKKYPTRGYMQIADAVNFRIGTLSRRKGLYKRAIDALEHVQRGFAEDPEGLRVLADCYARTERWQDALNAYSMLLRIVPDDREGLLAAAKIHRRLAHLGESRRLAGRLRALYPNDPALARELRALENGP